MMNEIIPNLLDCTIRDGSYATGFYWDAEMLRCIVSALSGFGIEYIEIGNGTGMGACRKLANALSDREYYDNTLPYKGNSKIGSFFIPGIGTEDDLRVFRESGGDFVRIGANVTELKDTYHYIGLAKRLGFFVTCNLMKTYALSKFQLVSNIKNLIDCGVDCIYIVDSSGGMLPNQVEDYFKAIQAFYDIPLGFHGHNNLLLANANSLKAIECGAVLVDSTLGGLGRGAGNAQTESMIAILQKLQNVKDKTNLIALSNLSDSVMSKLNGIVIKGCSKREIIEGVSNFHSSFTSLLEDVAQMYNVDPEQLLMEVSKVNVVDPSRDLFELVAKSLVSEKKYSVFMPRYYHKKL